ncbi:hypothetical protein B0H63DRAFT_188443 [Podospora didyma]|uniref:Rhodopsin domain-containing protein n=1 Tax=Podospora didyma TaxID=330526 RepID=A0AAE0U099_9PEZI|nr:hypothetical protein B0H63DRAFT_188443 [Podospora didyma]
MDDRRPAIVAVIVTFQALSWISIALRVYVRFFLTKRRMGWDDVLIVIAMCPVLAQAALQLLATKHGLGLHVIDMDLSDLTPLLHMIWWSGIMFNLSHLLIKLSYLALYLCLTPNRRIRIATYGGIAFVTAVGVTFTCLSIFMCTPIIRGWDKSVLGTCINDEAFLFSNATFNMAADIIVFVIPIPMLWGLQLPLRQRLILLSTFTCGAVILVASAVRINTIFGLVVPPTRDPTWDLAPLIIWAEIEVNIAIILACAGSFKALMQSLFPSFMDGIVTGSAGKTAKSQSRLTHQAHALQSRDRVNKAAFQTVIEASPRPRQDDESVDSREHIVDGAAPTPEWPRMQTTISVHSSKRDSADEGVKNDAEHLFVN